MEEMLARRTSQKGLHRLLNPRQYSVNVQASIHARWCLDVRYGCKQEATALLQEWVARVGFQAGLTPHNTRLSSGALGVPESRLEMEVTFDSMAEWETFLASVPFQEHKAWTQRIQSLVVDGSPVWQVHRSVDVLPSAGAAAAGGFAAAAPASQSSSRAAAGSSKQLVITDEIGMEDIAAWHQLTNKSSSTQTQPQQWQQEQQGEQAATQSQPAAGDAAAPYDGPLDWKGEPMKLNPGDKLPFKFL